MTVSAMFGIRIAASPLKGGGGMREVKQVNVNVGSRCGGGATSMPTPVIECSSRPQKKSTAHHMKSRPKKTQPWDIRRRPTVYAPLPHLPPEWSLVSPAPAAAAAEQDASSTPQQPPLP